MQPTARRRCGRRNLACNDSLRPSALKGSLKVLRTFIRQAALWATCGALLNSRAVSHRPPRRASRSLRRWGLFLSVPVVKFKFMRG
jgi:hypothetical protein